MTILGYLKKELNNTSLNDFDREAVLRKNYFDFIMDSLYGIQEQTNNTIIRNKYNIPDPLKMVIRTKEEEGFYDSDLFAKYLGLYISSGILKFTGISFLEFLSLPMHEGLGLITNCKKYVEMEMNAINKTNANMLETIKSNNKFKDKTYGY